MQTILKNKHILLILFIMTLAIAIVSALAWNTLILMKQKNGFNRTFLNQASLTMMHEAKKDEDMKDIAGTINGHLYFKTKTPDRVLITNLQLNDKHYLTINVPNDRRISSAFVSTVDSPRLCIMAGNMPGVIVTQPDVPTKIYKFQRSLFTRAVKVGPDSYVFRGFDSTVKMDQIFIKRNLRTGEILKENNISEYRHDAGIATDGLLTYDSSTHLLLYTYFYCNKFLCLDTNLNLKYVGRTIDTVNLSQTHIGKLDSKTITNTTPARTINEKSCVSNGKLYNESKLKADNETDAEFRNNSVVDIYNIRSGKYEGSIYIPNYKNEKIGAFKIINQQLIALYKNFIVIYHLAI